MNKRLAEDWLRYAEHDRERTPSTVRGYRSMISAHLLPAFGEMAVEDVTAEEIERWIAGAHAGAPRLGIWTMPVCGAWICLGRRS